MFYSPTIVTISKHQAKQVAAFYASIYDEKYYRHSDSWTTLEYMKQGSGYLADTIRILYPSYQLVPRENHKDYGQFFYSENSYCFPNMMSTKIKL